MTRILLVLLTCFVLVARVPASERAAPELTLTATGQLEIGPDGRVRSWTLDSRKLGEGVERLLQRNIESWRFEPILKDGKPVIASTRMTLELAAVPQGNDYLLTVQQVYFGGRDSSGDNPLPKYPPNAVRAGLGARVLVHLKVDATGNVVDVHAYQTSLSRHERPRQAQKWRRQFEEASLAAVREWKLAPGAMVDGAPIAQVMAVPIHFQIVTRRGQDDDHLWRAFVPGPVSPAPWVRADSVAALDDAGLDDGQSAALDSPFKLRDDVVGKAL